MYRHPHHNHHHHHRSRHSGNHGNTSEVLTMWPIHAQVSPLLLTSIQPSPWIQLLQLSPIILLISITLLSQLFAQVLQPSPIFALQKTGYVYVCVPPCVPRGASPESQQAPPLGPNRYLPWVPRSTSPGSQEAPPLGPNRHLPWVPRGTSPGSQEVPPLGHKRYLSCDLHVLNKRN